MPESKPYNIPKKVVMEAYRRVKANKGSAGIDGMDFEEFECSTKRVALIEDNDQRNNLID